MKTSWLISVAAILALMFFPIEQSHAGFGLKAGGNIGRGKMGNESNSIPSRTMNALAVYGMPGYSFMGFLFGALLEYRTVGQTTSEADAGNTNLRGSGYTGGLAVGYDFLMFHGVFGYDFMGQYKLSNSTSTGQDSVYTAPAGYRLMVGYRVIPMFSADFYYSDHKYSKNSMGGTETDLSGDKLKDTRYGIGLSFHF